jgi:hypothetical protein
VSHTQPAYAARRTRHTYSVRPPAASFRRRSLYQCRARLSRILDLLAEDSWLNVYAGELKVRPPAAPTISRPGELTAETQRNWNDWSSEPLRNRADDASVDSKCRPRDGRRLIGRKERHEIGDLIGAHETA